MGNQGKVRTNDHVVHWSNKLLNFLVNWYLSQKNLPCPGLASKGLDLSSIRCMVLGSFISSVNWSPACV